MFSFGGWWSRGSQIPCVSYWLMNHPYTSHSCWSYKFSHTFATFRQKIQPHLTLKIQYCICQLPSLQICCTFSLCMWMNIIHWMGSLHEYEYHVCRNFNLDLFIGKGIPISFKGKGILLLNKGDIYRMLIYFILHVTNHYFPVTL